MADENTNPLLGLYWEPCDAVHPYDSVFREIHARYVTEDCLRILAASGFIEPRFESKYRGGMSSRRCWVTGPDGERHSAADVLHFIFKAERLERLCQDRSDVVMGMLRRSAAADKKLQKMIDETNDKMQRILKQE